MADDTSRREREWRTPLVLAVLSALLAGVFIYPRAERSRMQLDEIPKIASHLAQGHGYRSPLDASAASPYTCWIPPGYPFLMSLVYRVTGVATPQSLNICLGLNAIFYGAMVAGVFVLARTIFDSRTIALLAAAMVGLNPLFLLRTTYIWETFFSLSLFVWLTILALRTGGGRMRWGNMLLIGLGCGILALTNAAYVLVPVALVLIAARAVSWPKRVAAACVSLIAFAVVVGPWTIRNYRVSGQVHLIRAGLPLETWLGNRPMSTGWQNLDRHPSVLPAEGRLMLKLGENEYFDLCNQRFRSDYLANPGAFFARTARRVAYLLVGDPSSSAPVSLFSFGGLANSARVGFDAVSVLLGLAGLYASWRLGFRTSWIGPLALLAGCGYLFTHVNYRYAMPGRLLLVLPAAFLVYAILQRLRDGHWPAAPAPELGQEESETAAAGFEQFADLRHAGAPSPPRGPMPIRATSSNSFEPIANTSAKPTTRPFAK